jgi:hypothetical protein
MKSNTRRNIKILKPRGKSQGIEMKPVIVLIATGIAGVPFVQVGNAQATF